MAKIEEILSKDLLDKLSTQDKGRSLKDGGGLTGVVHVDRGGGISVAFTYQFRVGKKRREKRCGTWPLKSLSKIRAERNRLRSLVSSGVDPIESAKDALIDAEREKQARLEQIKVEDALAQAQLVAAAELTMDDLFQSWDAHHGAQIDPSWRATRRSLWRCHISPCIGKKKISTVTAGEFFRHFDQMILDGKVGSARRALTFLKQVISWGLQRQLVASGHELLSLSLPVKLKVVSDDQKIENFNLEKFIAKNGAAIIGEDAEYGKAGRAIHFNELTILLSSRLPSSMQAITGKCIIRFMLATGIRASEAVKMRWAWISREECLIVFPAGAMKARKRHDVHLSPFALKQLEIMSELRINDFVFPAPIKENSSVLRGNVGSDITTRQFYCEDGESDEQYRKRLEVRLKNHRSRKEATLYNLPNGKWTLYDLRRTVATRLCELIGEDWGVVERILAHAPANTNSVTPKYARFASWNNRCWALNILGDALMLCEAGDDSRVNNFVLECQKRAPQIASR
ncbi:tyrosine-type recombinase/integrase [Deefgea piscis]|uniref:Tyrosine-type recombinase/integrase n=1 Tax=Deefgea piscis TaxID=2739061 RepID=A0A6M8SUT4_9NEIS|nr:tyrosine-type recombinase/integrase [Deefgea piscis]QKJ67306.1 tyrosine-type recombinase/integrase [Deefgea piscis]